MSEWIFAGESATLESWEPFEPTAPVSFALQALVVNLESREGAFYQPSHRGLSLDMEHSERSLGCRESFWLRGCCRAISDRQRNLRKTITVKRALWSALE
jgi:hypothetical protein